MEREEALSETQDVSLLGACNEGTGTVTLSGQADGDWPGAQNPLATWSGTLSAYQYGNWYSQYGWATNCVFVNDIGAVCQEFGAQYFQDGFSVTSTFDLVTAAQQAPPEVTKI